MLGAGNISELVNSSADQIGLVMLALAYLKYNVFVASLTCEDKVEAFIAYELKMLQV